MTDPIHPDPRFPNRPNHPDFMELANLVLEMDDPTVDVEEHLGFIDEESLTYFVGERLPILMKAAREHKVDPPNFMMALYIEAMSMGYHLSQRRRGSE